MAAAQVLMSIGIIAFSFVIGLLFFYVTSPLTKLEKKKQIEEVISQLINFVIFIWIGKVLTNLPVFISDPLTILAYPSNSHAFYVAVLLIVITISYKVIRHKFAAHTFLISFVPIFLAASFVYEFIGMVYQGNTFWGYLALLMGLLVVYMVLHDRVPVDLLTFLLLFTWVICKLILALTLPFTTVFGYMVVPWFLVLLIILFFGLFIYNRKGKVSS